MKPVADPNKKITMKNPWFGKKVKTFFHIYTYIFKKYIYTYTNKYTIL